MEIRFNTFSEMFTKGKRESFLSSKYLFRKISIPISFVFAKLGVSSNTITFVSLIFAISGAFLQTSGEPLLILISIGCLLIYTILDHCDGELARYEINILKLKKGPEGPYFDALVHYLFTPIFYFAIGFAKYLESGFELALWEGVITGIWLSSFSQASALRVTLDRIIESNQSISDFKSIWLHDKVIDRGKFTVKQTIRSIIRETFSTQGQIIIISLLSIIDIFKEWSFSLRFVFLDFMFILSLIGIIRASLLFFNKLKEIK